MHTHFITFVHIHGNIYKRMKTPRRDQSRKLLYLFDKETIHLWRTDKAEGFGLQGGKWWSNMVCLYSLLGPKFPVTGDKDVPPGTGRVPVTWEMYLLLSGQKGGGGSQSDLISAIFSNSFSLRYSLCHGAIFWDIVSWTLLGETLPFLHTKPWPALCHTGEAQNRAWVPASLTPDLSWGPSASELHLLSLSVPVSTWGSKLTPREGHTSCEVLLQRHCSLLRQCAG